AVALAAWWWSSEAVRFLAVLVVATPCPLLLGIPVTIIGAISLAAKRGIIIRDPVALEQARGCETLIFDKTGTLTYGEPHLVEMVLAPGWERATVLGYAASLEQYSRHPLARAVMRAAQREQVPVSAATEINESPGRGLSGIVQGRRVHITGRPAADAEKLPPSTGGMECVVWVDGEWVALIRFRDEPRAEGSAFVGHLRPRHRVHRVVLLSGDRRSEVEYLARAVGIGEVYAGQSPEQKLALVQQERARGPVMFVGDGINDAPALTAATVGNALGAQNEITTEAAAVVVMDSSLGKVDEFLHISRRFRRIALQSAVGGMVLSMVAMGLAFLGYLPPVAGALVQEVIDVLAVSNALRMAWPPAELTDF
ncbi:MAG: HAD-IC family P-type ATPase, partial [Verrucomicrobiae bacterium]|nr:HAD-IC family P-type ATPase [Verrucomicrobiae bacterium]